METKPVLTIVIPTFNRNAILARTIVHILPQLNDSVEVRIIDNASDTPVATTLDEMLALKGKGRVKIVRNRLNVGATANIMRSFELCDSKWLWILGDDDIIKADAIHTVLGSIERNPDAILHSFLTVRQEKLRIRKSPFESIGLRDFAKKLDFAHQLNFMSCSVWRAPSVHAAIRFGYDYAYSMGWTFSLLLHSLGSDGRVIFSPRALVTDCGLAQAESGWSYRRFILGWPTLLEAPMDDDVRQMLAKKMLSLYSPEVLSAYMLAGADANDNGERRYFYRLAVGRLKPYASFFTKIRYTAWGCLFYNPRVGWRFVRRAIKEANRMHLKSINIQDLELRNRN